MPDDRPLTPATEADLEQALAHALQYDGRRRFKLAGESIAQISAARLVRCLAQSGFVIMRTRPRDPHSNNS